MDTPMIFVKPRDRNSGLRHPSMPTRQLPDAGDFWPDDGFTHRRVGDGGITLADAPVAPSEVALAAPSSQPQPGEDADLRASKSKSSGS